MSVSYTAAANVGEVLEALAAGARPVAGGTDLVVGDRQGKAPLPEALVAIHAVSELHGASTTAAGGLRLGALVTHSELMANAQVIDRYTALADASAIVGSHATRHVGTLGGNVMNASPAMETGGPLICLGAVAVLTSQSGDRRLGVDELLAGPGRTTAAPGELLTAIELPAAGDGSGSCYVRLEYRRHMEIAVVGATCAVRLDGGRVADARIAITALAPTIRRVPEAEQALNGSDGSGAAVEAAAGLAAAAAQPISDVRASADYRRAMAVVIARRAIAVALARAGGQHVPVPASSHARGV